MTVTIRNVDKAYGRIQALKGVSFNLDPGRLIALVGHNGAGKTTLIKLMLGLIRADHGVIEVLGTDPRDGAFAVRREIGYLPENVAFNGALTGRETLAFYARLKRIDPAETVTLLARVGLSNAADRRMGTYSKGMRQRLGLAQAILGRPRVLLLDEPTTGLDPALRQTFYEIVAELRGAGTTVLISSHALSELEGRADRVLIMNRGSLIADGALSDLRALSRLPTCLTIELAGDGARRPAWLPAHAVTSARGVIIQAVDEREKMILLRHAAGDPHVSNVEIAVPTLDELYAHFLGNGEEAA